MKIEKAKHLTARKFKRMAGVSRQTFELMVDLVKADAQKKKKSGRRPKLIIEDQVLMVLQYWREYRTYYHIGLDFGLSESAVCRLVFKIENILIKSRKFRLPGKKELWKMSSQEDLVVMDVTESPIEKPQKGQKRYFSGKQGEHTLKTQVVIRQKSSQIICLGHGQGRIHDFKLFKSSGIKFGELLKVIADKGYQGIAKIHQLSETPIKKPKGKRLTKEQKKYNRELNRLRIVVEHVNRRLKIFKILSDRYRNPHRRFGLRSNLIAGIYNHELAL
ncbi:Transposase (plasmid) [Nostoc flagelliforme CCNUN1]|uniref:Transposase n=1 Tax=Nostoc flagelliforme CCNUN1 TaxID=2038116 RepID=A0A2K8SII7_9NOSO|nr:IS5 family transposase [Nostoc flagelliforme]AUB35069.1 Transposase [Nostoc flagelliforme CCNUN1]AUB35110.1 Transposase [Nostoc flagelliforme CCNUN1]AUB35140.1 Transposase [Nostoc flagelliforme CCNUN1]AUB39792.1 Transposase [Nostoc flagelliforme CCNUN1]AUB41481.1 Transposase [Nostoc flagelliforme CCNUN1]